MLRELAAERAQYLVDMCKYDERRNEQSCKPVKPTDLMVARTESADEARELDRIQWLEVILPMIRKDAARAAMRRAS